MRQSQNKRSKAYLVLTFVLIVMFTASSPTSATLRPNSLAIRANLQAPTTTTSICPPLEPVVIAPPGTNNLVIPIYIPAGNQVANGNNPISLTINPCSAQVPPTGFLHVQLYFTSNASGVQNGCIPTVSGGVIGVPVSVFAKGGCAFTSVPGSYKGKQIAADSLFLIPSMGTCTLTAVQYLNPLASVPRVSIPATQEATQS